MNVRELAEKLNLTLFCGEQGLDSEITDGYTSDLLSDVMGNAKEGDIWITLQTHKNVVAIASLKDIAAVVLVKNNSPAEDVLKQAEEEGIPILGTDKSTFDISGQIYEIIKGV